MRSFPLFTLSPVNDVSDLLKRIAEIRVKTKSTAWFRGHGNDRECKLIPSIGRKHEFNGNSVVFEHEQEKEILHRFRRHAYPHTQDILNEWEALFLARHHGLPTRVLDWTRNPLAALYFASVGNQEEDGSIWVITRIEGNKDELDVLKLACSTKEEDGPFEMFSKSSSALTSGAGTTSDAVKIVYPFYNSPRLVRQDGAFTLHSNPRFNMDEYADLKFADERLDIATLHKISILKSGKKLIIKELDGLGINRRTFFPDLDGIAQSIYEAEILWKGKKVI